jgi:hypothetical protein
MVRGYSGDSPGIVGGYSGDGATAGLYRPPGDSEGMVGGEWGGRRGDLRVWIRLAVLCVNNGIAMG